MVLASKVLESYADSFNHLSSCPIIEISLFLVWLLLLRQTGDLCVATVTTVPEITPPKEDTGWAAGIVYSCQSICKYVNANCGCYPSFVSRIMMSVISFNNLGFCGQVKFQGDFQYYIFGSSHQFWLSWTIVCALQTTALNVCIISTRSGVLECCWCAA